MKVCLINPPQTQLKQPRAYIPLGLAYIGAVAEQHYDVVGVNLADVKRPTFADIPDADVYGITCNSATFESTKEVVSILKNNKKFVIVGGVHPTIFPEITLGKTGCNCVITGEAEHEFLKVLEIIDRDMEVPKIVRSWVKYNIDDLPFPARHLFKDDVVDTTGIHGQPEGVKATTILASRGCPYRCTFCCKIEQTINVRVRNPESVVLELKELKNEYGIEHVRFIDDIFTLNPHNVSHLCDLMIKTELDMTWICITHPTCIRTELLNKMKAAGCVEVHIGVDSGSPRVLKEMKKGTTVEKNVTAVKMIKEAGIRCKTYLMCGFPGETDNDLELTRAFLIKARPDALTLSRFTPVPGSRLWEDTEDDWFYPDGNHDYEYLKKWFGAALR